MLTWLADSCMNKTLLSSNCKGHQTKQLDAKADVYSNLDWLLAEHSRLGNRDEPCSDTCATSNEGMDTCRVAPISFVSCLLNFPAIDIMLPSMPGIPQAFPEAAVGFKPPPGPVKFICFIRKTY
jgi:hypothetical protein